MKNTFKLLDAVALLMAMPEKNLPVGQVGTVVEIYGNNVYEVEFADLNGRTLKMCAVKAENLLLLQYDLQTA